ncbi:glycosyltransferase [Algibacter sp. 2305UL17-15]|uniref:glycosyltransferase n=1 Tax=Algibacter sp. 2305UL17-15 TaxID=3231268 RepID=UPI003457F88D
MVFLDIALYAFMGVVLIQVIFYLNIFGRFAFLKQKTSNKRSNTPVSVLVCAKNEAENLKTFLPSIIDQDYKNFEIVLINDGSHDDTLEVMETFANQHENIKIVNVKPLETFWGNKKYPLTLGVKAATHNVLLFTDADCKPLSKHWISEMASHFNSEKSIVLGYGAYDKIKNSFLNKLIRFETLTAAISYFSFAKLGMPYMGVGRNLAYTKKQFFKVNGFMGHMNISSGDDDLFVNEAATNSNTAICFSEKSLTSSIPKKSFKDWYVQKRRHVSTAKYYKRNHKVLLALFYITNVLFWGLAILLLSVLYAPILAICLILFRITVQYIVYVFSAKKLHEKDLLPFLPFLEIFLITFQLAIFISNKISKPKHWK